MKQPEEEEEEEEEEEVEEDEKEEGLGDLWWGSSIEMDTRGGVKSPSTWRAKQSF